MNKEYKNRIANYDWFKSGHEYGIKDKVFMDRGMERYLSFIGLVIQRK